MKYVGQIQSWSSHLGNRTIKGAIYDTARMRADTGDMGQDFSFVEFIEVDRLQNRLVELNSKLDP